MPWVWVSIGSNIDRERMVKAAVTALRDTFGDIVLSPVYETPAEGFVGEPFYNLVAGFETTMKPGQLHSALREIEAANGRVRGAEKFSARTLDIDALTYGNQVTDEGGKELPRDEIVKYAFVLQPLADVAPDEVHPETGVTYLALWQAFQGPKEGVRVQNMEF